MLDLVLQCPKALRLQSPNEPKCCDLAAVSPFNLEGHLESSIAQPTCCKARATPGPPLQPSHVARPAAVPPGHPCGAPLPHSETPVQPPPQSRSTALCRGCRPLRRGVKSACRVGREVSHPGPSPD